MRRFEGKVAIVTGGARGIGYAPAGWLMSEGARVAVLDIDKDAADDAVRELRGTGGEVIGAACDVRDQASVEAAVAATIDAFSGLHVLVNNVGIGGGTPFGEVDDDEWDRQVEPTLRGAIRCIQASLPSLLAASGGGAVVSISSVNGMAAVGDVPYSAAKAGVISATQNLAVQYGSLIRAALAQGRSDRIPVAGVWLSLDDIEHGMLRGSKHPWGMGYLPRPFPSSFERRFRLERADPRIHPGGPRDRSRGASLLGRPVGARRPESQDTDAVAVTHRGRGSSSP
jgi:NADP-dependent 3-hydroxy acid dehydrogenase YdfG